MSSDGGWTTIESEPGVFHQLIAEFGVQGLQVEELWSLDKESLEALRPVYGLVFLFKWTAEKDTRAVAQDTLGKVFFAKQVIQNACATQAILSVLLNTQDLDLGPQLQQFREFTADFPPDMKGLAIGNSDNIRLAHNSFARPEPIVSDEKESSKDDEAFHFISYVPVAGMLYELDGLKEGPIPLCPCSDADWLEKVVPNIQERMARYAEKEVRFNIMAIVKDRLMLAQAKIATCTALRQAVMQRLGNHAGSTPMEADGAASASGPEQQALEQALQALPTDSDALNARLLSLEAELAALQHEVQEEQDKRRRWHEENIRRRHNYVPFLFNMLRMLAAKGQLTPLVDRAKAMAQAKKEQGASKGS